MLQRAVTIIEASTGPDHPVLAMVLISLGLVQSHQGDFYVATKTLERALTIAEMSLGPHHPVVATSLLNLSDVMRKQGEHGKAKTYMKRAKSIHSLTRGLAHPHTVMSKTVISLIDDEKACIVCGERGLKLLHCSLCMSKYYCSAVCQVHNYNIYQLHYMFVYIAKIVVCIMLGFF